MTCPNKQFLKRGASEADNWSWSWPLAVFPSWNLVALWQLSCHDPQVQISQGLCRSRWAEPQWPCLQTQIKLSRYRRSPIRQSPETVAASQYGLSMLATLPSLSIIIQCLERTSSASLVAGAVMGVYAVLWVFGGVGKGVDRRVRSPLI